MMLVSAFPFIIPQEIRREQEERKKDDESKDDPSGQGTESTQRFRDGRYSTCCDRTALSAALPALLQRRPQPLVKKLQGQ